MAKSSVKDKEEFVNSSPAAGGRKSRVEQLIEEELLSNVKGSKIETTYGEGSSYTTLRKDPKTGKQILVYKYAIEMGKDSEGNRRRVFGSSQKSPIEAYRRCIKNAERRAHEGNDKITRKKRRTRKQGARALAEMTLEEYYDRWIADLEKKVEAGELAANTVSHYKGSFRNHILPALGHLKMWQVEKEDIKRFYRDTLPAKKKQVKEEGEWVETDEPLLNASGIRNVHRPLKKMFNYAVEEDELFYDSPVRESYVPKNSEIKPPEDLKTVLAKTELALLLLDKVRDLEDEFTEVWLRLNYWGLRQGERAGLCWSAITDLETPNKALLSVERQFLYESGYGYALKPQTKTKHSERVFPISEGLRQALLAWKKKQDELKAQSTWRPQKGLEDLVLTTEEGKPWKNGRDTTKWHKFREKHLDNENPKHKPHIIDWRGHLNRHITATIFHSQGVDIETAMRVLGHSDREMTRYYTAMAANSLRPSIDVVDEFYEMSVENRKKRILDAGRSIEKAEKENESPLETLQKRYVAMTGSDNLPPELSDTAAHRASKHVQSEQEEALEAIVNLRKREDGKKLRKRSKELV
ncbi:tyrosine-type recombinase/integrase [Nesterenkonia alba]|uniref:tyrosine-type recombinase/integrase n=1 Tax=Nesterenkonia alba TaxID=515814 RepID=UPI0003B6C4CD|nr:tyrosine-type recombinase/integrase [Nesterenkonia alba]